jgi:hypothetical protein
MHVDMTKSVVMSISWVAVYYSLIYNAGAPDPIVLFTVHIKEVFQMKKFIVTIVSVLMLGSSATAFAHSGGTNQNGCHNQYSNGSYHCH